MKMKFVAPIILFVGAQPTSALANSPAFGPENDGEGSHKNSASSANLSETAHIEDYEDFHAPRGLRGTDVGGIFNSAKDDMPRHSKLVKPPENVTVIDNEYLVVLEESVADVEATMNTLLDVVNQLHPEFDSEGFGSLWNINDKFKGQAVRMTHEQAETMSEMGGVMYIESNVELVAQNSPEEGAGNKDETMTNQENLGTSYYNEIPWNLDRIDQKTPKLDGKYNPKFDGSGIMVVILDSGVLGTHSEFGNRVISTGELIPSFQTGCGREGGRLTGDGTFKAGIVGGLKYGVAKGVQIIDIRESCGPSLRRTTKAAYYVDVLNHIGTLASSRKIVVNGGQQFFKGAVQNAPKEALVNLVGSGVVFVTEAGDGSQTNTCTSFPANLAETISVGATEHDIIDGRATEDVFQKTNTACADIYAPGVSITSAAAGSDTASEKKPGSTSFAAPHVTGAAAMILQQGKTAAEVKKELLSRAFPLRIRGTEDKKMVFIQPKASQ